MAIIISAGRVAQQMPGFVIFPTSVTAIRLRLSHTTNGFALFERIEIRTCCLYRSSEAWIS
jgi:hypothetical protein